MRFLDPGTVRPLFSSLSGRRDLDFAEIFSGFGETSFWVRQRGLEAHEFDQRRFAAESCTDAKGVLYLGAGHSHQSPSPKSLLRGTRTPGALSNSCASPRARREQLRPELSSPS